MSRKLSADPIRIKGPYPDERIEEDARKVARAINSVLEGPRDKVRTWADAAEALGCEVIQGRVAGGGPAHYHGATGTMVYNPRYPAEEVIKFFKHELAHHVLVKWPRSRFSAGWERYDDNRKSVQHRIAERVEELLTPKEE